MYLLSTRRQGTWADSETERALKSLLGFCRNFGGKPLACLVSCRFLKKTVVLLLTFLSMLVMVFCVFFPHFSLMMFSVSGLQILSFAVVLHSPPTLSRSLLTQSFHHILSLPRLLFPPPSVHLISASFSSPILSHMTGPFQPTPHQFLLKTYSQFTEQKSHSPTSCLHFCPQLDRRSS